MENEDYYPDRPSDKDVAGHTPGPWHHHEKEVHTNHVDGKTTVHCVVANCSQHNAVTEREAIANAALIAAAPDYHEAAEHILTRSKPNEDGTWTVRMNEMVELHTAYTKAEE